MTYWLLVFWLITAVAAILLILVLVKESKKHDD
jgi:hypothetical protein